MVRPGRRWGSGGHPTHAGRLALLAAVMLLPVGCGDGAPGEPWNTGGIDGASTGAAGATGWKPADGSGDAGSSADDDDDDDDNDDNDDNDDGSSGGTSDPGDDDSTGGPPPATCGDGVVDPGEDCDDANASEFDGCTTSCRFPTCVDGSHNGTESGVDCGGPCGPCGACGGCNTDDDCLAGSFCGPGFRCTQTRTVTVDWLDHCPLPADGVVVPDLPAGTWRAIAVSGAGSVYGAPPNPPATGWAWKFNCQGVAFDELETPDGIHYATPEEAFDNLIAEHEDFVFGGGDLTCYKVDGAGCADNQGSVTFDLELQCQ